MNTEIIKIFEHFSTEFNRTYKYMTGKQKKEIGYLSSSFFSRWYYSALFPETILSPSAIFSSQPENIVDGKGYYSANMHFKNINNDTLDFSFKESFYSIESHPIYKDLDTLINYIVPAILLDSDGNPLEKDIRALQKKLTISDRFYVIYLFRLAEELELYTQIPSLFDVCIQPAFSANFYKLSSDEKLNQIISASCNICADTLNDEIPFEFCFITPSMIYDFLINPISIDNIFVQLYKDSDIDLENVWNNSDSAELNESDSAILSSVFYVGIYFDKAFIHVFGHYLRLIRPIYSFPLNFREIINSLYTTIAIDGERESEIFMPSTAYSLTLLGKLAFKKDVAKIKKYPIIPVDKILSTLQKERTIKNATIDYIDSEISDDIILQFKVLLNKDRNLWKKIELEGNTSLNEAAKHTFLMFMLPDDNEYSIKIKSNNKETAQFMVSNNNIHDSRVCTKVSDIIPDLGKTIIFRSSSGTTLELTYTGCRRTCSEILYPRIIEQSQQITASERKLYLFDD